MTNENNMLTMPNNNMMQTQPSQIPNCNMMNGNIQFSRFVPQHIFACPIFPFGYGPYNKIDQYNQNINDGSSWLSN